MKINFLKPIPNSTNSSVKKPEPEGEAPHAPHLCSAASPPASLAWSTGPPGAPSAGRLCMLHPLVRQQQTSSSASETPQPSWKDKDYSFTLPLPLTRKNIC